jgi:hypothetical protein
MMIPSYERHVIIGDETSRPLANPSTRAAPICTISLCGHGPNVLALHPTSGNLGGGHGAGC